MAEVAFIVVTSYFALLVPAGGQAAQMVRARLVFEAFAALAVLVALPRVPGPARIAAMVLAVFVLIGCLPALVLGGRALAGSGAEAAVWLSFLLSSAACASQAVVLGACLSVPRGTLGAD